jgi:hypothetical protein
MASLKVIVISLDTEIFVAPLDGETEEMVGAVVSGVDGAGVGAGETYSFSGVDSEPSEHPV